LAKKIKKALRHEWNRLKSKRLYLTGHAITRFQERFLELWQTNNHDGLIQIIKESKPLCRCDRDKKKCLKVFNKKHQLISIISISMGEVVTVYHEENPRTDLVYDVRVQKKFKKGKKYKRKEHYNV